MYSCDEFWIIESFRFRKKNAYEFCPQAVWYFFSYSSLCSIICNDQFRILYPAFLGVEKNVCLCLDGNTVVYVWHTWRSRRLNYFCLVRSTKLTFVNLVLGFCLFLKISLSRSSWKQVSHLNSCLLHVTENVLCMQTMTKQTNSDLSSFLFLDLNVSNNSLSCVVIFSLPVDTDGERIAGSTVRGMWSSLVLVHRPMINNNNYYCICGFTISCYTRFLVVKERCCKVWG